MQKIIRLEQNNIEYTLNINKKSKSIRLAVHPGGFVVVTAPRFLPQFIIDRFLISKADWLTEKIEYFTKIKPIKNIKEQKEEYLKYKKIALQRVLERIEYFNKFYNLKWNRITIRNQKTRWGSCSRKGNINFNYKIALIPENQANYIIVHELCHLKEMNHRKEFWKLVSLTIPDSKNIRKELRNSQYKIN